MTKTAPPNEATGPPRTSGRPWPDFVGALLGSIAGGYLIGGLLVRWGIQALPGFIFGPILLIPLGSALGTTLTLAFARRHSPVLTGILMLPVTVVVWLVVVGLTRVINVMDFGWLVITPPVVAPLGARWIVIGRKEPPEPALPPFRDWPIRRIVRYGVLALLGITLIWFLVSWLDLGDSDPVELTPQGPRACECEQLKEWFASLVISPDGDRFRESNIRAAESPDGFVIIGSQSATGSDPYRFWDAFGEAGFNGTQLPTYNWSATFFEGDIRRDSPWIVDVILLQNRIELTIRVRVDGSDWGIGSSDQLWELYVSDRQAALEVQTERQARAVDTLEPVERALAGTVG